MSMMPKSLLRRYITVAVLISLVCIVTFKGYVVIHSPRPPKSLPQLRNSITLTGKNEILQHSEIQRFHRGERSSFEYSISPDDQWIVYIVWIIDEGLSKRTPILRTTNLGNGSSFSFELPESKKNRGRNDLDETYVMLNIDHDGWTRDSRLFFVRDKIRDPRYDPLGNQETAKAPAGYVIDYSDQKMPRIIQNSLLDEEARHYEDKKEVLTCSDCPIISYLDYKLEPHLADPSGRMFFYTKKEPYRLSLYEDGVRKRKLATILGESPDLTYLSLSPNQRYIVFVEHHINSGGWSLRSDSWPINLIDLTTGKRYLVAGGGSSPHWDSKSEIIYFLDDHDLKSVTVSESMKYPRSSFDIGQCGF